MSNISLNRFLGASLYVAIILLKLCKITVENVNAKRWPFRDLFHSKFYAKKERKNINNAAHIIYSLYEDFHK